jgi:CBS domain-containing protein
VGAPVSIILERKGADVATLTPDRTLADAAATLTERGIGALVVSSDGERVEGVLSERDIVRVISREGAGGLDTPVREVMTTEVVTCDPATSTDTLVTTMTERRIRHVPVLREGRLAGIVSIGDIVKWRMEELTEEAQQLEAYVAGSY